MPAVARITWWCPYCQRPIDFGDGFNSTSEGVAAHIAVDNTGCTWPLIDVHAWRVAGYVSRPGTMQHRRRATIELRGGDRRAILARAVVAVPHRARRWLARWAKRSKRHDGSRMWMEAPVPRWALEAFVEARRA
jgi:hypothetical protein